MKIPENLIPLIYLLVTAAIGGILFKIGVSTELVGALVGAGLMRVKIPAPPQK